MQQIPKSYTLDGSHTHCLNFQTTQPTVLCTMGMCLAYTSISDINMQRIIQDPPLIWLFIAPDEPEVYLNEIASHTKQGLFSRLLGRKDSGSSTNVPKLDIVAGERAVGDLDKAWHGLHYCLAKTSWDPNPPMDFLLHGGQALAEIDLGYGPARLFDAKAVERIGAELDNIGPKELKTNFAPDKMKQLNIYLADVWVADREEGLEYLVQSLNDLKAFISSCRQRNLGMALWLT